MRGSIYGTGTAGFLDYFVMRDGEPAAKMIANVSGANNNQTFRAKAPLYLPITLSWPRRSNRRNIPGRILFRR